MKATDFLLCVIDASGGIVNGRTLLQKRAFFLSELTGIDAELRFDAHYYGPYSSTVEGTTTQLKILGFIQEASTGFGVVSGGFEIKRYDYSLTDDGRRLVGRLRNTQEYKAIESGMQRMIEAGDPNYIELSIAAKAYFLLKKKGDEMSTSELQREAEKYSWSISPQSIDRAVHFLESLGLAKEA
jgi:uncharacterized protein YwgA